MTRRFQLCRARANDIHATEPIIHDTFQDVVPLLPHTRAYWYLRFRGQDYGAAVNRRPTCMPMNVRQDGWTGIAHLMQL
jgi:hypothetical protein